MPKFEMPKGMPSMDSLKDVDMAALGGTIGMGTIFGFTSGFALKKVGTAAAVVFGSIFVFEQALAYFGYITVDWKKVEKDLSAVLDVNHDGKIDQKDLGIGYKKVLEVLQTNGAGCGGSFAWGVALGTTLHEMPQEPNPATLPILRNNKRLHRSGFEILPMILSRPGGHNLSFSNMGIMAHIAKPGEPADFVLPTVDRDLSAFTVVVSDCEGCFCLLFKEFPELLRGVRLVINEIDGKCDYDFAALLRQHGFHRVDGTLPFVDGHPAHDVFSKSWFDWRKGIWSHWSQLCVTVRKLLGQPPLLVVAPLILALSATLVYLVFFSSRLGPGRDSALLTWIRTNTALELSPVIGKSV